MKELLPLAELFAGMTILVVCGIYLGRLTVPRQRRDARGHFLPTRIKPNVSKSATLVQSGSSSNRNPIL